MGIKRLNFKISSLRERRKPRSSLENYTSNNTTQHETTRHNTRQHEYNTTQHETTQAQHETTRVQHETARVLNNIKFTSIYLFHRCILGGWYLRL